MSWESDWKSVCKDIMNYGIPKAIDYSSEEDVMKALKKFPYCPNFYDHKNPKNWGNESSHKENWKQAQQWFKIKEYIESEKIKIAAAPEIEKLKKSATIEDQKNSLETIILKQGEIIKKLEAKIHQYENE